MTIAMINAPAGKSDTRDLRPKIISGVAVVGSYTAQPFVDRTIIMDSIESIVDNLTNKA